ncbi:MAG: Flp family type IVb pilin [Bryobacteraceae bacterium]
MELLKNFWKEEEGQDLIEYALLLGFISLAVVTIITQMTDSLTNLYGSTSNVLKSAAGSSAS